ncbi:LysM peptidoglycan-binding domain-containing protein [Flammeovirgaceae bacterium SG7u.111]|nr:LysM peptidoglycan-binding domain-containing protein [Flammeovirgaceae bacterium SG7u.132]WPO35307.1 LysM peptidoglycan-binding domain-containing protein [Flammeovirgaceae bacterium SG7u.111]
MPSLKRLFLLATTCLLISPAFSQEIDSTYTVEPPEGYEFPWAPEEEIVSASDVIQEANLLKFDTTSAILLEEIAYDRDYIPTVSDEEIMARLKEMEKKGEIPMNYHARVRLFIDFFSVRKREFTLKIMQRKNLYFPLFEKTLAEYGMPDELKYLSIIESALVPSARSRVGAVGLWQFMPRTGRAYGLKQSYSMDDRMDPEKATIAACKYLKFLHDMYGDWELAIAAYNCGPGNVNKAKRRSGKFHFWDIYEKLPRETRSYLPQFVAMAYVLNYADEHNLVQEQPFYATPSQEIFVSQSVDFGKLAQKLNICEEDLAQLNPRFRYKYVPSGVKDCPVKIPAARFDYFMANKQDILDSVKVTSKKPTYYAGGKVGSGEKVYYTVRRGDVLGSIAQRHGVKLSNLRSWNNLYTNTIYPGQKLVMYGAGAAPAKPSTQAVAKNTQPSANQVQYTANGKVHVVREGDTLWGISKKYNGVTVDKIRKANNLKTDKLKIGQKLKLG